MTHILNITASSNPGDSISKSLSSTFLQSFSNETSTITVDERDVSKGLPLLTPEWVGANFTPEEERSDEQKETLTLSDTLIHELEQSDLILLSTPIYNFGIPASLKAWVDLISRARKTFKYTPDGPVGLLDNKKVVIFIASGGTVVDSPIDFATPYLRHAFKFIGITDVTVITADALGGNPEAIEKAVEKASSLGQELGKDFR